METIIVLAVVLFVVATIALLWYLRIRQHKAASERVPQLYLGSLAYGVYQIHVSPNGSAGPVHTVYATATPPPPFRKALKMPVPPKKEEVILQVLGFTLDPDEMEQPPPSYASIIVEAQKRGAESHNQSSIQDANISKSMKDDMKS